jgi:hypothetical protein
MSYKLSGFDRDTVKSLAIHQDSVALIAFIEALVDKQAGQPLPAGGAFALTPSEQKIIEGLRGQ